MGSSIWYSKKKFFLLLVRVIFILDIKKVFYVRIFWFYCNYVLDACGWDGIRNFVFCWFFFSFFLNIHAYTISIRFDNSSSAGRVIWLIVFSVYFFLLVFYACFSTHRARHHLICNNVMSWYVGEVVSRIHFKRFEYRCSSFIRCERINERMKEQTKPKPSWA